MPAMHVCVLCMMQVMHAGSLHITSSTPTSTRRTLGSRCACCRLHAAYAAGLTIHSLALLVGCAVRHLLWSEQQEQAMPFRAGNRSRATHRQRRALPGAIPWGAHAASSGECLAGDHPAQVECGPCAVGKQRGCLPGMQPGGERRWAWGVPVIIALLACTQSPGSHEPAAWTGLQ